MQLSLTFDRAFYKPRESVNVTCHLHDGTQSNETVHLCAHVTHLIQPLQKLEQTVQMAGTDATVSLTFTPPAQAPRGYGLDVVVRTAEGEVLTRASAGFDVLQHWTDTPRYGFLSDFAPGRYDALETMRQLTRYHVNALQFYDWMYRHEQLLPPQETYIDPLERTLSLPTVQRLIDAAHRHNIAAMPYTAVYAASVPFYKQHPDWALYHADGSPHFFGEDFLVYMDPRPESPWVQHLLGQFEAVLEETAFDGIHLDQYGEPLSAYDMQGEPFELAEPLATLINATGEVVQQQREAGAVVFNAVRNWPVAAVAPTAQDLVYIEVWDPYNSFADLHTLIIEAQQLSAGKPVVLAAYVDPAWEHNVQLVDAIIFASGGAHIELGEHADLLADPYFPNYRALSPELANILRRYYDFAVRYQDVIGPRTQHGAGEDQLHITVDGVATDGVYGVNGVWPILRNGAQGLGLNLINLRGLTHDRWQEQVVQAPTALQEVTVTVRGIGRTVERVWLATPDENDLSAQPLDYAVRHVDGEQVLMFTLPSLAYWSLIVI